MSAPASTPSAAASALANVEISAAGAERCAVRGALTFASARRAYDSGIRCFAATAGATLEVDLTAVQAADSAGLAVLLGWLAWAREHGRALRFTHIPEAIQAIARISEVENLLTGGAAG